MTQTNQLDAQGLRHGLWEVFFSDGTLSWRGYYHHGKVHGPFEGYYKDGTISSRCNYNHGTLKGLANWLDIEYNMTIVKKYYLIIK